jgi:phenylacetate-CoA ligase
MLGGQLVTAVNVRRPPFWVWNAALNQLYMSTYHLAPDLIRFYLEAVEQYRIKYLLGYPSAIHQLAEGALALGKKVNLEMVVVNAEPLLAHQREAIIEAFQCPVRETYGLAETVAAASECENGVLHLWPEAGFVEVPDGQAPADRGVSADLIATGFINTDMPLIRYRTGDRIALGRDDGPCKCGRTLPKLAMVEGRCDDLLFTKDGRRVGRLDPVFKGRLPIREAQIVQETLNEIRVLCVPTSNFNNKAREQIMASIRSRMGDINVVVEEVDELPRTANGKLRAVICKVPAEEKARM